MRSDRNCASKRFLLLFALGLLVSCQSRESVLSRTSPDGTKRIAVWRSPHAPDYSVGATYYSNAKEILIFRDNGDHLGIPAEIYWSPDSKLTGILVCSVYSKDFVVGFDTDAEKVVSESLVADHLRQLIVSKNSPSTEVLREHGGDPLRWFCRDPTLGNRFAQTEVGKR